MKTIDDTGDVVLGADIDTDGDGAVVLQTRGVTRAAAVNAAIAAAAQSGGTVVLRGVYALGQRLNGAHRYSTATGRAEYVSVGSRDRGRTAASSAGSPGCRRIFAAVAFSVIALSNRNRSPQWVHASTSTA